MLASKLDHGLPSASLNAKSAEIHYVEASLMSPPSWYYRKGSCLLGMLPLHLCTGRNELKGTLILHLVTAGVC
jgi:hypothetical protein